MRTACTLLALLAGVAASSGASIELSFGPNTSGTVDQVEYGGVTIPRVTLRGSDFAYIDIVLLEPEDGLFTWIFGTSTDPADVDGFTFDQVIPGPQMYAPHAQPEPGDQLDAWKDTNYVYPYIYDGGDVLLVTLVVHCTGIAGETLVMLDDLSGEAFIARPDQSDYDIDFAAPMVLIRQLASDGGGGGGGAPVDDGTGDENGGDTDTGDEDDPADPGTDDTDNDGLPDADDPDDDDDGVPDADDAEPQDPDVGAVTDDDGASSGGGTSGGAGGSAGAPCGAGMITALPIWVLGWCGLVVLRRSHRPR
ncbi:MAG: hypothetical protein JXB13_02700 [Phycisphaerae bacterium]|nr:hypothetical protein [Phycisphaerae bacterium]